MRLAVRASVLALLISGPAARAATGGTPLSLVHSGYLLDGADAPLTATVTLSFGVFPAASGGAAEWSGSCAGVEVRAGYYALDVGGVGCTGTGGTGDTVLDTSDLLPGAPRWLEVKVAASTLAPRLALGEAPTAKVAGRALTADRVGTELPADLHDASRLTGVAPASVLGTGSAQLATVGTVTAGEWQATPVADTSVASASTWHAKLSSVAHDATLTGAGTEVSPLGLGTDGSGLQGVNAAKLGGQTLAELQAMISGGQTNTGTPAACAPATTGLLFFDTSVPASPTLKVCNGAAYVAIGGAVTPPPGPPAAPTVTSADGALGVSWSPVTSATGYEVGFTAGTALGASPTEVAVAGTTTTLPGLTNGQVYAVAVRTVANQWRSAWSGTTQATPAASQTIVTFGTSRRWSDGTYARSCAEYLAPTSPYAYSGQTGNGIYTIDPDGSGVLVEWNTHCDMSGGGWTLVASGWNPSYAMTGTYATLGAFVRANTRGPSWTQMRLQCHASGGSNVDRIRTFSSVRTNLDDVGNVAPASETYDPSDNIGTRPSNLTYYQSYAEWHGFAGSGNRFVVRTNESPHCALSYEVVGTGVALGEWGRIWVK